MTKTLTVAAAGIKLTPLDFAGNVARIVSVISKEKKLIDSNHTDLLIVFPELCLTGYGCEDAFFYSDVTDVAVESLNTLLPYTDETTAIVVGLPFRTADGVIYNCAALLSDKKIVGIIPKQNLANDGIHYERRWFTPGVVGHHDSIQLLNQTVLFGDYVLPLKNKKIGFEICEDAWVQNRPAYCHKISAVDIIVNPSASHFAFGKFRIRRELVRTGSLIANCVYVFANQLGNEAGRAIYDGDAIIADKGEVVSHSPRLTCNEYNRCHYTLSDKNTSAAIQTVVDPSDETVGYFQDFTRAVALGLYDYLNKSKASRFVLSLSGGADSGIIALLVSAMVHFGVKDKGFELFRDSLHSDFHSAKTPTEIMQQLLYCVYQGTANNSSVTLQAAQKIAECFHASFYAIAIDDEVSGYTKKIESILNRSLTWDSDNIALQNIQARVRAPGIWLLTNAVNALLLTTGNRSESSVGYSTMDGDTSGSLAPIAGVSKAFIQRYLVWMQTNSVEGFGPFPQLDCITSQLPTAELKPLSEQQTDEKDLMPYVVLEFFEVNRLHLRKSAALIINEATDAFKGQFSPIEITGWYKKFEKLWRISQWKRDRLAPGFHLDTFSVDSRGWLRYPIFSGA